LAISISEGWAFIAQSPVNIGAAVGQNSERFVRRAKACSTLQGRFERAYGQWANASSGAAAMQAHLNDKKLAAKRASIARALATYQTLATRALSGMTQAQRSLARHNRKAAAADAVLLRAITAPHASQASIAKAAGALNSSCQ
jgi:hypothetical protein